MAEVFIIFFATLFGWDVLQPVHLLWINLVTDTLPAIALGVEPAEPGIMTHKPRGRQSNFFDGGVFRCYHVSRCFPNHPRSCSIWLGSCLPRAPYTSRNSCGCPYNGFLQHLD